MGAPKLLLKVDGQTLLSRVIASARASRCDDVLVVLGANAAAVGAEARRLGARTVANPRYADGMGTSLAAGIAALPSECEAAVVLLGDQPGIAAGAIDALIDAFRSSGRPIVVSRYGAVAGAPTLFGRGVFEELRTLEGDSGGRPVVARHPEFVTEVSLPEADAGADVDTPEDLERFKNAAKSDTASGQAGGT